jgi:hypothetical protein
MGAGIFGISSESKTRVDASQATLQAGDNSTVSQIKSGKNSVNLAPASTYLRTGKGGDIEYVITNNITDGGLFSAGSALLGKALDSQFSLAEDAQDSNAHLAETKITDGANLTNKTAMIAIAVVGMLVAVFFYLKKA